MKIIGVILAGGRSSRMGADKAFVTFNGRPLVEHVLARFAPQVADVVINANGDAARFAAYPHPVLPDRLGANGPLCGVASGLNYAQQHNADAIVAVPVDGPLLPLDLVDRLTAALNPESQAVVARSPDGVEPTFALWRVSALPQMEIALEQGIRGPKHMLEQLPHASVLFDAKVAGLAPFANLNTREELADVERRVLHEGAGSLA
ncbi:molybdenum cofactor guanylyltransferase MobA [Methylovirgula sp. 4M-Z18]|uniref:molybdenum cofactor guanylyltransferase MobA n=1 Tax=Methylovirgula sp. 4M-Z18 TaxID=2293567 RepID=UPI000E2E7312|nr:molybdenum cofactor guanylyltransferase MobA [Methylovirgula sp. 4M-Z18]RFB80579.1 molybdenum cofactor guanylyltransferase [Methylovirgula sp. 4M-Z18]